MIIGRVFCTAPVCRAMSRSCTAPARNPRKTAEGETDESVFQNLKKNAQSGLFDASVTKNDEVFSIFY